MQTEAEYTSRNALIPIMDANEELCPHDGTSCTDPPGRTAHQITQGFFGTPPLQALNTVYIGSPPPYHGGLYNEYLYILRKGTGLPPHLGKAQIADKFRYDYSTFATLKSSLFANSSVIRETHKLATSPLQSRQVLPATLSGFFYVYSIVT